jgi:hypothetical protein
MSKYPRLLHLALLHVQHQTMSGPLIHLSALCWSVDLLFIKDRGFRS